jgi:menaquinone-dependent protoporphyrinogen IX oxidase
VFLYVVFEKDEEAEPDRWQWKDQIFKKVQRIDILEKKVALLKGAEAKVKKLDFQMETLMKLITKKPKKKIGQDDDDEG